MSQSLHPTTQKIVAELDQLYGLYDMAIDLAKRIQPDDESQTERVLEARKKILDHTEKAGQELNFLLKGYVAERFIPQNEKALVEEKRNLLMDLGLKMQASDNLTARRLLAKMAKIRSELAGQTERKNAIRAYIRAPKPLFAVQ